jgi:hypothetical protein
MVAYRKAINQKYYAANHCARTIKNDIKSILAGRRPWASTLKRFDLGERELNRIHSLDAKFRTILGDKHGVELESLYDGKTPLGEMRLPDVKIIEIIVPPAFDYPQGLDEVPTKGLNIPITWAMSISFWGQKLVRMHEMGSNAALITMEDGELVSQTYKKKTKNAQRTTLRQVMELFDKKPDQNAIPTLKNANEVMNRLALANQKSDVAIEADRTIMDEAEGAVPGADDDDDEEVSSGPVAKSKAGAKVR